MTNQKLLFKQQLYTNCLTLITKKLEQLNSAFAESREALGSEAKSTAGDKHETGRAMIQLEQEKMGRQLAETQKLQTILSRVNATKVYDKVQSGALVETDSGYYFIAVGIGKMQIDNQEVFVMAPTSPLAQAMLGKATGDGISFNGKSFQIKSIT